MSCIDITYETNAIIESLEIAQFQNTGKVKLFSVKLKLKPSAIFFTCFPYFLSSRR